MREVCDKLRRANSSLRNALEANADSWQSSTDAYLNDAQEFIVSAIATAALLSSTEGYLHNSVCQYLRDAVKNIQNALWKNDDTWSSTTDDYIKSAQNQILEALLALAST